MKSKKIVAAILMGALMFSNSVFALGAPSDKFEFIECGNGNTKAGISCMSKKFEMPVGEPIYENRMVRSKAASITVKITSPCDDEFRKSNSNYTYEADKIIERTDDWLNKEFGIDFLSVSQQIWSSSETTSKALIKEAMREHGLTYDGNKTADLMVAFTGVSLPDKYGIAAKGQPYAMVIDTNYNQNTKSAQHEIGHTYGLDHHTTSGDCVMKQGDDTSQLDHLCSSHHSVWEKNKSKY